MVQDAVHRFLVAVHHLQHAVGQAGLLQQFAPGNSEVEGTRSDGFRIIALPAGQRRAHLPQRDHGGEVEGRDAGHHAKRLAHGVKVDAGAGAVGHLALQHARGRPCRPRSPQARAARRPWRREWSCHVRGRPVSASLSMFAVDQRAKGHHHPRAALRVGGGPADLRLGGFVQRRGPARPAWPARRGPALRRWRG